jgi:hypothetical protein
MFVNPECTQLLLGNEIFLEASRDSSVSGYSMNGRVQFLVKVEIFLFKRPMQLTVTGTRGLFPGKYARNMKLKHQMPNAWNYTFTPHISLRDTILMYRGTFRLHEYSQSEKWKLIAVLEMFWYLDCN